MKTIEYTNTCGFCGDDADDPADVEIVDGYALLAAPGTREVRGQAAISTSYVRIGARIVAVCQHCKDALKAITDEAGAARDLDARSLWTANHKPRGVNRIAEERTRLDAEDLARAKAAEAAAVAAAEATRIAAERIAAAQAERADAFSELPPDEQLKTALAAILDGSASKDELELYRSLVG